jgi:hypothetical protein
MLALDATGLTSDPRFNLDAVTTDPFTELPRNLRIRMTRREPDGSTLTLAGPEGIREETGGVNLATGSSLYRSGAEGWALFVPAGREATVTIEGDPALALGLTLVRVR